MTEFRITRSRDIELYVDDEQLFGVTEFRSRSLYESHKIREYLCGEPHAVVNGKTEYELRLSVLSLFRYAILDDADFSLRVVDEENDYIYDGCAVIRHDRCITAGKNVVDEYVIAAKSMRKQVRADAG